MRGHITNIWSMGDSDLYIDTFCGRCTFWMARGLVDVVMAFPNGHDVYMRQPIGEEGEDGISFAGYDYVRLIMASFLRLVLKIWYINKTLDAKTSKHSDLGYTNIHNPTLTPGRSYILPNIPNPFVMAQIDAIYGKIGWVVEAMDRKFEIKDLGIEVLIKESS